MEFHKFLRTEVQDFLKKELHSDLIPLLLKKSPFADISMQELVQQIKGQQVAEKKFPFLLKEGIVFPPQLNLEQSSSVATAQYKANLLKGERFLDLTTGFGIDAYFLSENFPNITLVEQNEVLQQIVQHNWQLLGRKATFFAGTLEQFLKKNRAHFDVIYLDPARRSADKKKVFLLQDLSPNLLLVQEELLKISDHLLVKLSPMIDVSYLVSVLKNISRIDIIAVKNEVKEILVHQSLKIEKKKIWLHCVNLQTEQPAFSYDLDDAETALAVYSEPEKYLYIPNNAILKSGSFNLVSQKFNLSKLHPNTHLYTSGDYQADFPGRILQVKEISSKEIKKGGQMNIISKNYPLTTAQIEKKYKLKQGGNQYLIFTQTQKAKVILQSR